MACFASDSLDIDYTSSDHLCLPRASSMAVDALELYENLEEMENSLLVVIAFLVRLSSIPLNCL